MENSTLPEKKESLDDAEDAVKDASPKPKESPHEDESPTKPPRFFHD